MVAKMGRMVTNPYQAGYNKNGTTIEKKDYATNSYL